MSINQIMHHPNKFKINKYMLIQLVQVLRVLAQNPSWKTNAAGFKVKLIIINKIYAI